MTHPPLVARALDLLNQGHSLIPVRNKVALVRWRQDPESLPVSVKDCVGTWGHDSPPDLAIRCGHKVSGLSQGPDLYTFCIDIDDVALADRVARYLGVDYYLERSPRGGLHVWCLSETIVHTRKLVQDKVDLKGEVGYAVTAPSGGYAPVPDTANAQWLIFVNGDKGANALMDGLGETPTNIVKTRVDLGSQEPIHKGSTHIELVKMRGNLARIGFSGLRLEAALRGLNEHATEVPITDEEEITGIADWIPGDPQIPVVQPFITVTQLHPNMEIPPTPPDLIENYWPGASFLTYIHGDRGCGKSYVALLWAVCLASGTPFMGAPTIGPVPVDYFDWELDEPIFIARVAKVCAGLGIEIPSELFYYRCTGPIKFDDVYEKIAGYIATRNSAAYVMDSAAPAFGINIKDDMEVIPILQRLQNLNTPGLIIAHEPRTAREGRFIQRPEEKDIYGSVFQGNLARAVWQLIKTDGGVDYMVSLMAQRKQSFGNWGQMLKFRLSGVRPDSDTLAFTEEVDENLDAILERLHANGDDGTSSQELQHLTGLTKSRVAELLVILRRTHNVGRLFKTGRTPMYGFIAEGVEEAAE